MPIDVLVCGAGPVGLAMASELARYGVSVRVIDKNEGRTDKSKALVIWARTLELMERMGPGCAEKFIAAGMKVDGANIFQGRDTIGHVDLTQVESRYNFALMLPQSDTERLLEEHLAGFGVKVERQTELTKFSAGSDSAACTLVSGGKEEAVQPKWLIGCDGAHSAVRHGLGMEFSGSTMLVDWILADVHLEGLSAPPAVDIWWDPDGVLALFPIKPGRYRVIADIGPSKRQDEHAPRLSPTLAEVQSILDQRGPGNLKASDPIWLAGFTINERKVSDYRSGRIFLAGDAAHVHSPAGGQGMNTGIHDACNLAWKLAIFAHGACADAPVLASYSPERSGIGKILLEATGRATSIAVMKGGVAQSIRNHIASLVLGISPVRRELAQVLSEIAIGYPESPMNAQHSAHISGGPSIGKRAPIRDGEPPVGAGNTPRFALFSADFSDARAVLAKYPNLVEPQPRAPYAEGGMWLVRPDGYVALVARAGAWSDLDHYLAWLAGSKVATAH
jgi:2-polyprenyl-6-methoxyphenol hydroxylase-like FAD-dependent oxidoreductase